MTTQNTQHKEKPAIKRLAEALTNHSLLARAPDMSIDKIIEFSEKEAIVIWRRDGKLRAMHYKHDKGYLKDSGYGFEIDANWNFKCDGCKSSREYQTTSGQFVDLCSCSKYVVSEILERRIRK